MPTGIRIAGPEGSSHRPRSTTPEGQAGSSPLFSQFAARPLALSCIGGVPQLALQTAWSLSGRSIVTTQPTRGSAVATDANKIPPEIKTIQFTRLTLTDLQL
jgi:hypothetical protein